MGIHRGPNMEKGGLVFGYDTGHGVCDNHTSSRFYQGKPTTNYLSDGTIPAYNVVKSAGWHGATPTFTKGTSEFNTPIGTYNTSGTSYMYSYDEVLDDDLSTLSSQVVTFSIYLRRTDTLGTVGMRIYDNVSGYSTIYADVTGQFQRFSITKTLGANPTRIFVMIDNTNGGIIDFHSPMLEKGEASPFVDGTRSSTESLIDLKRTTDIDLSSMSFDSTDQPTFDGTDDYLQPFDMNLEAMQNSTLEAIIYMNNLSGSDSSYSVFGGVATGNRHGYHEIRNSGSGWKMTKWTSANGWRYSNTALSATTWYHVIWVWEGLKLTWYLNGEQDGTYTFSTFSPYSHGIKNIGSFGSNQRLMNGNIPVAKVYGRALTPDEIKQNFNTYKNRFNI